MRNLKQAAYLQQVLKDQNYDLRKRTTFTSSPQHISIIVFPTFVFLVY